MQNILRLTEEGGWPLGDEGTASVLCGRSLDPVCQRELDATVEELLDAGPGNGDGNVVAVDFGVVPPGSANSGRNNSCINNLDAAETSPVAACKFCIHLFDCTADGHVPVLLVHVVCSTTTVVLDGDSIVLDGPGVLFPDLIDCQHLTSALLELAHLVQKVPAKELTFRPS